MQEAISLIKAEHRSLAAVLHGLVTIMGDLQQSGGRTDFSLLGAMLDYVDQYPDRFHHPKEGQFLFRLLRARAPDAAGLLDTLETEHMKNRQLMGELRQALRRYQEQPSDRGRRDAWAELVRQYAEFHWNHMRLEEEQVFPLAESRLRPEDWAQIAAAFRQNEDPLTGLSAKLHYEELLRRIVTAAPAPVGVGAPWR
ncbi:hemerythrin domain-containing protein [Ferrovibrio sp.]|uniref:hemerythrin domain-containing protein n=1 Tax=Ferrovibrio sp. TaxID=1917215 RepID=UPI00311F09B9